MIHLLQLLCPERHAILAVPYNPDEATQMEIERTTAKLMTVCGIEHRCGICGSHDLHWEDGVTKWHTLKDAGLYLAECQAAQLQTRAALDAAGLTHDVQRNN